MKKRLRIWMVVFLGLVLACWAVSVIRPWEPRHGWKPLSSWLSDFESDDPQSRAAAVTAVRAMGTNALPLLLDAFHSPDFEAASARRLQAGLAFAALGVAGKPAIPELTKLLKRGELATEVATVLAGMGSDALPPLTNGLASDDPRVRSAAAFALGQLRGDAKPAIPALIRTTLDKDPVVRPKAIWALGTIGEEASVVVPALAESLADTNAVVRLFALKALRKFGTQAKPAVPALLIALQDPNQEVSKTAGYLLWIVDRAAATRAGVR